MSQATLKQANMVTENALSCKQQGSRKASKEEAMAIKAEVDYQRLVSIEFPPSARSESIFDSLGYQPAITYNQ